MTGASTIAPVLDPMRIIVGAPGLGSPASPIRTSSRCSMYVSGVVSGSMLTLIVRGGESISVPGPLLKESDSVGPVYVEPVTVREAVLGLDGEEAAVVVLEVVDAQDDDLVRRAT